MKWKFAKLYNCLADSLVFWVLSKMITHRWYLNIIKHFHVISPIMRSTEMVILRLGSVLLFYIPEATSINISRGGRQRNPLQFHSWFSHPLEVAHTRLWRRGEVSRDGRQTSGIAFLAAVATLPALFLKGCVAGEFVKGRRTDPTLHSPIPPCLPCFFLLCAWG